MPGHIRVRIPRMLKHTFCHVPGVGLKTEKRLWDSGVLTWDAPLGGVTLKRASADAIGPVLDASRERLAAGDPAFFSALLPPKESWRMFRDFRDSAAYIDIETNGYMGDFGFITAISLYDGRRIRYYVRGENLEDFVRDIMEYKVLVTYNGRCFDVPFIERQFAVSLPHAHIDLMYILRELGFRGGLKGCERTIGIDRGSLDGVDGYFAVLLWREYRKNRNPKAMETLLAYNIQDVVNLEPLMVTAHNMKLEQTPFRADYRLELPAPRLELPFKPDIETIERLKARHYSANA